MNNITNKKVLNVPHLRFPEFIDEWKKYRLGDVFTFKNGLNKGKEFFGIGTPIINYMDVYKNANITNKLIEGLVTVSEREIKIFSVKKGDVFFTRTSETSEEIGLTGSLLDDVPQGVFSGFLLRARPVKNIFNNSFAGYYFRSKNIRQEIVKYSSITTRALTSGPSLSQISISTPTLKEQEKISTLLSIIDNKIEVQRKLIDNYESLIKSIYTLIVQKYKTKKITLGTMISTKMISVIKPSNLGKFNGEKIYLSTSSIEGNTIIGNEGLVTFENRPSRASLKPFKNSVWFAKMKNSTKVFLSEKDDENTYIMSTGFYGFITNDIVISQWLKFSFLSDEFNQQKDRFSEGSSMSGVKSTQFDDIYIPIIENKEDLIISLKYLLSLEHNIKNSKETLKKLETLKGVLLNKMFI